MNNLLLPLLVVFSVINRPFANIIYFLLALCGFFYLFRDGRCTKMGIFFLSILPIYLFTTYFVGFPALRDFILELRPLFILPAGISLRHLVLKSNAQRSLRFFAILMLAYGCYLCAGSGFSFRFIGASSLPLGSVWVPTYATILYLIVCSGVLRKFYLPLCAVLLTLSAVNSIFFALVACLFLRLVLVYLSTLSSKVIKFSDLFQSFLLPILILISVVTYAVRRSLDSLSFDYDLLLNTVDRIAFYDAYIKSYIQLDGLFDIYPLLFGHGIGVSTFDWVQALPDAFREMNTIWYDRIGSSALLFQVELLRVMYSFGVIGIVFLIFSFLFPLRINWRLLCSAHFWFSSKTGFMLTSLIIMSVVTITTSTTGVFLGASYVLNCVNIASKKHCNEKRVVISG